MVRTGSMATTQTVARTPHILYRCTCQMVFSCRGTAPTTTSTRDSPILRPNGMARFARRWRSCWRISTKTTLRFSHHQQYVYLMKKLLTKKFYNYEKRDKTKALLGLGTQCRRSSRNFHHWYVQSQAYHNESYFLQTCQ